MHLIHKLFVTALIAIAFVACRKEIKFEEEDIDRVLVVNQIVEAGQPFKVYVERSLFFLDSNNTEYILNNATVTLTNVTSGQSETVNQGNNGYYNFGMIANAGASYQVNVTHPEYDAVQSQMTVPATIPLLSVDTTVIYTNNNGLIYAEGTDVTLNWFDPSITNHYMVVIRSFGFGYSENVYLTSSDASIVNNDSGEPDGSNYGPFFALDDALFNGTNKSLTVRANHDFQNVDSIEVVLYHVTEDVAKYLISAELESTSSDDIFTEPVKVHSNIEGGYGIFGAVNSSKRTFIP